MHSLYAREFAQNGQTVTVVAKDTDVLIMLVYHWRNVMEDVYHLKNGKPAIKTRRNTHYHSLRVYLQVVRWTVLCNGMLQGRECG